METKNQHEIGYLLAQLTRIWNQKFIDILRSEGYYNLKPSFCSIFFPLFEQDGQSSAEILKSSKITKQTVSIYVSELRQRGYIKLVQDENDKRIRRIYLTAKGSMLKRVFESANKKIGKDLFRSINNQEVRSLSVILEKSLSRYIS